MTKMFEDTKGVISEHSTHLQVGGDNPIVEGGILQNQYTKQSSTLFVFYFHFDIFIFENKVAWGKIQLGGQFAQLLWNAL